MSKVNQKQLDQILKTNLYCVVYVDANWNNTGLKFKKQIEKIENDYKNRVVFAYINCDEELVYTKEIGLLNVPAIAYYAEEKLKSLKIGENHDVKFNIDLLLNNVSII